MRTHLNSQPCFQITLPPTLAPADLTVEQAAAILRAKAEGPRRLGVDPATSQSIYAIHGRFGEDAPRYLRKQPTAGTLLRKPTDENASEEDLKALLRRFDELRKKKEEGQ